jgi:hypothetical protein
MSQLSLQQLFSTLSPDPWRTTSPFTPEMCHAQEQMFATSKKEEVRRVLLEWLGKHQPCLFGRLAAKSGALAMCILFEDEILQHGESWIVDYIESARTQWHADTFRGDVSGFVFIVVSRNIAFATPDAALGQVAKRMCSFYLNRGDVNFDTVYHDETFLEVPGEQRMAFKWIAGVNYFCANGDGRWWRDHRIPGGLAFSSNSVGHLVKSDKLRKAQQEFWKTLELPGEVNEIDMHVDSLPKALRLAMQTIHLAADGPSGKATYLLPRSSDTPPPPVDLTSYLSGMEHRHYHGYYHTDMTLPSEYFVPDELRASDLDPFELDFSYLFESSIHNPDYKAMGLGRRIRMSPGHVGTKCPLAQESLIEIASSPTLSKALDKRRS